MKNRQILLMLGDLVLLYGALYISLYIRYYGHIKPGLLALHLYAFAFIFPLWIITYYIANLYSLNALTNLAFLIRVFITTLAIDVLLTIAYFYANPEILIAPKTVLLLVTLIFIVLFFTWRLVISALWKRTASIPLLLIGDTPLIHEVKDYLHTYPHVGYKVSAVLPSRDISSISSYSYSLIVASKEAFDSHAVAQTLYSQLSKKVTILDLADFCELIMGKIPLRSIDQLWFLRNLKEGNKRIFDVVKRGGDIMGSLVIGIVLSPLAVGIAVLVKFTSKGPLLYRQTRVGTHGSLFKMTKFRSMIADAEKGKAQWAQTNDPRITSIGSIIRKLRLDEIPQLWNIFIGEMSFVGPRPERPEFVSELKKTIPFYEERLLLKPGLSGWAQVNYPYTASVDDSAKKLEYDLYYLKNRSLFLDFTIVLRTISIVLAGAGQ